jgi:hypothetical protein
LTAAITIAAVVSTEAKLAIRYIRFWTATVLRSSSRKAAMISFVALAICDFEVELGSQIFNPPHVPMTRTARQRQSGRGRGH